MEEREEKAVRPPLASSRQTCMSDRETEALREQEILPTPHSEVCLTSNPTFSQFGTPAYPSHTSCAHLTLPKYEKECLFIRGKRDMVSARDISTPETEEEGAQPFKIRFHLPSRACLWGLLLRACGRLPGRGNQGSENLTQDSDPHHMHADNPPERQCASVDTTDPGCHPCTGIFSSVRRGQ